jgi:hypothetical protein
VLELFPDVCPICGEEQLYSFDETDIYYWCYSCRERREEEEKEEKYKKWKQSTVVQINELCDSNIDEGTLDLWMAKAREEKLSGVDACNYFLKKIHQLQKKSPERTRFECERSERVTVIPPVKK